MVLPDDRDYDAARALFYGGLDRRPAVVVHPADPEDVARVVRLAAATGAELAVRSGGHGALGHASVDGGIVLDLGDMARIDLDVEGRTAWVGAGATTGDYTRVAGAHGLATGFGDAGTVGIGGLTVGGGIGLLARKHGMTIDHLLAAEVVTELTTLANVMSAAPPMPFLPEQVHGTPVLFAMLVYAGDTEEGERVVAPFRALAPPLADMTGPMSYADMFPPDADEDYHPTAVFETLFRDSFDLTTAERMVGALEASTAPTGVVQVRVLGGAMGRVAADATAYAHRDRRLLLNVAAMFEDPAERAIHQAWVDRTVAALSEGHAGRYVNFLGADGEPAARAAYPAATWQRLATIKATYDPDNLFRHNVNIAPATT